MSACSSDDGGDGLADSAASSETRADEGGEGGECAPSASAPGIDASGPYGPCASGDDCDPSAHTCNTPCGGACSMGCSDASECPAAGDYPVDCRPSSSGSDPTGDCIITCDASADCPAGMACAQQSYCVWASG